MVQIRFYKFWTAIGFLAFFYCAQTASAQSKAGATPQTSGNKFQVFFEKVYLHLDRDYFTSGEDIWFKAYLVNGQSNYSTATSNNLYVELISSESKLMSREVIRLDNGTGVGDFKLQDSIPSGVYRIRAYTKWMLNFGELFVFEKKINIQSSLSIKPKLSETKASSVGKISFCPEGGSLVNEVLSVVAFKATDNKGNGCPVKGAIISASGDTVCKFADVYLGMGKFNFIPIKGQKYFATGTINNVPFKNELPIALEKGLGITVSNHYTSLLVNINTNKETLNEIKNQEMKLVAKSFGKTCFSVIVKIRDLSTVVQVPKFNMPAGITCFTLFDNQSRPNCERLFFVDRNQLVNLAVTSEKINSQSGDKVSFKVKAFDNQGNPVSANLSLAVVDANLVNKGNDNIISYLMLESDIKGKIEKPSNYFDPKNASRFNQLDLLLLTQGWRDFIWKQLEEKPVHIQYMMEPGITISGRVREKFFDKPVAKANITLTLPGSGLRFCKADSLGRYFLDGLNFTGSKHIRLMSHNMKNEKSGWLLMDSLFTAHIPVADSPFIQSDTIEGDSRMASFAVNRYKALRKYHLTDTILLNEVKVKGDRYSGKTALLMGGTLTDIGYKDREFVIGPKDHDYYDIGFYLLNNIPEATMCGSQICFQSFGKTIHPRYLVYEKDVSHNRYTTNEIYMLTMDQIEKIVYSHKGSLQSKNDVFIINLYVKPGAFEKKDFYTLDTYVQGYYQSRVFYGANQYDPSLSGEGGVRPTIHWEPNIVTDKNGEAVVSFYNTNKSAKLRATVEGITDKGIPVCGEGVYNVK